MSTYAPWTPEQVDLLNRYQKARTYHPFTCGDRGRHRDNDGVLVATESGWLCPTEGCGYTQNWAHSQMVDSQFVAWCEKPLRERLGIGT